jgi:2-keto-4-pentenoate hydratase/2-oxohepta-3-ene-1,7-dioic acid hydratase in catechol pathway
LAKIAKNGEIILNVYCVGRNYVAHIEELKNETPTSPLIFMKPSHAVTFEESITLPHDSSEVHHELELVVKMASSYDKEKTLSEMIAGVTLGIDFTLRDVQSVCKDKGLPWLPAKGFKESASLCGFSPYISDDWWQALSFSMKKNGEDVQIGNTNLMIYNLSTILSYLSENYGLGKDDIIYTGTPAGVGPVKEGDTLELILDDQVIGIKQIHM